MRVIKPWVYVYTPEDYKGRAYKFIEKIGRTCYKSEDKITTDSAIPFVLGCIKRGHLSITEHWYMYFTINIVRYAQMMEDIAICPDWLRFINVSMSTLTEEVLVSGSMRAFYELFAKNRKYLVSDVISDLETLAGMEYPGIFPEAIPFNKMSKNAGVFLLFRDTVLPLGKVYDLKKIITHTVRFVCDRGVSHELVRHRNCAFTQESTRYCNYGKGEVEVIRPYFFEKNPRLYDCWKNACGVSEIEYNSLIAGGATPQEARTVLPNSLKTEIVVTATEEEWQHIINLRYLGTAGTPHPQMKGVMEIAAKELAVQSEGRIKIEKED